MDKVKRWLLIMLETTVITGTVLLSVLPVSCKVTTQGIQIIGGNYEVPQLVDVIVVDDKTVSLEFSKEIKLNDVVVSYFIEGVSDSDEISFSLDLSPSLNSAAGAFGRLECEVEYLNNNRTANINLVESTEIGSTYEVYGVVIDKAGNSLTFCVPFSGYNSRIPELQITEIHPAMAGIQKTEDAAGTRRLEYVEFVAKSSGNLAGLEFCSGYAGDAKNYSFPPVEVQKGEVFVLHLRTWGEGCISEESGDLNAASSRYTGPYRDLWSPNTTKPMGDKNDIIAVRDIRTGKLIDVVMYSDYSISEWSSYLKTDFTLCEDFLRFYENASVSSACSSAGVGTTKVLAREGGDGGWSVTTPSPGSL